MELHIFPRRVISWKDFVTSHPFYSLALDGYVDSPRRHDSTNRFLNFNHHGGVRRLTTQSACMQTHRTLMGQDPFFVLREDIPTHVFVNDPDQDTSLSVALLRNRRSINLYEPKLTELIYYEDMLDVTAGVSPSFDSGLPILGHIAWMFQPYTDQRQIGAIHKMDDLGMLEIIDQIDDRFQAYLLGKGRTIKPDLRYEVLRHEKNWAMIREIGSHSRGKAFKDLDVEIMITYSNGCRGNHGYGLITRGHSERTIKNICKRLNQLEGIEHKPDNWGGGDLFAFSPREKRSGIPPDELGAIVQEELAKMIKIIA